jgi:hypothetical protein
VKLKQAPPRSTKPREVLVKADHFSDRDDS